MIDVLLDPLVWIATVLLLGLLFGLFGRGCLRCAVLSSVALCLLVLVASPAFANRWLATLEGAYPLQHCDIENNTRPVVVLAGGMTAGYREFPAMQRLNSASKNRALAAAAIVKPQGQLFIAGGRARNRRISTEADAMESLILPMLAEGVVVTKETDSESTYENGRNMHRFFEKQGLAKDIVLVTSALHMRRAVGVFQNYGFEVCTYSVDPLQHIGVSWMALWPQVSALNKTRLTLHEWVGWLFYRQEGFL